MQEEYKEQQAVERGFWFLKDPWFMVDSVFLKTPLNRSVDDGHDTVFNVYHIGQHQLRQKLVESKETLPNQLGKGVKNPTLRWIFQIMEGIGIVRLCGEVKREIITNLTQLRR